MTESEKYAKSKFYAWQAMVPPVSTLQPQQSLLDAAKELSNHKLSAIPVVNETGKLMGVVSGQQILSRIARGLSLNIKVAGVMENKNLLILNRGDILNLKTEVDFEIICVCEKGVLIGVVYQDRLLHAYEWKTQMLSRFESLSKEYEMILNHCFDSIYVTDEKGNVLWANSASERISLKKPIEVIGKNVYGLEVAQVFFPSSTNLALQHKKCMTIFQEVRDGDKVVCTSNPVFDEQGKLIRVVTVTRDVDKLIEYLKEFANSSEIEELFDRLKEANKLNERYYSELSELRRERIVERELIGCSQEIKNVVELAKKVASVDTTVLILGESGVGKDVIAAKIHEMSDRREGPFMKINCGAIPDNLLESELFGYEPGAFTGARKERKLGLIAMANEGTFFLDEIAELPLNLQVKLLQVIQDKKIIPLGGIKPISVDIRIIAATNKDIKSMVEEGKFRQDLFYRLNVISILIPPLRERKEDIPQLIMHFIDKFNRKYSRNKQLASKTMDMLLNYEWLGNVRELENMIESLVVICEQDIIKPNDLPANINAAKKIKTLDFDNIEKIGSLGEAVEALEAKIIEETYKNCNSTIKTAKVLGVNQSTIVRKLKKYQIS